MNDSPSGDLTQSATPDQRQRSLELSVSPPSAETPTDNARYEIRAPIARGGMGAVHRAWDSVLERSVAIKVLLGDGGPAARKRFEYEARITGQLQHPNIAPIYDLGTLPNGLPFLAMKLIEGRTLADLLKSEGTGSARWLATFEAICQAVGYAHRQGFIHRDLKPLNVMVGEFGEVQVMDWGLAKRLVPQTAGDPTAAARSIPERVVPFGTDTAILPASPTGTLFQQSVPIGGVDFDDDSTKTGSVMGTPSYMAPEQARGEIDAIDRRADVFSIGAILCELLTGAPPLRGSSSEVLESCAAGRFEEAFRRIDGCGDDPVLIALAKRCLAVKAYDRPDDASEVAAAVARYRADADARAKELERRQSRTEAVRAEQSKRRRVLGWSATAVFLAMTLGLVAAAVSLKEARRQERIADGERTLALDAKQLAQDAAARAGREAETADEVSAFLVGLFEPRDKLATAAANLQFRDRAGDKLLARDLLTRGVELLKSPDGLNRNPLTRARLLHEIAAIHFSLGDAAAARPLADEAVAIRTAHLPENDPQLVKSLRLSAQLEYLEGDYAVCVARHRDAIARLEALGAIANPLDRAETEASLGLVFLEHDNTESARLLQRAYDSYKKLVGAHDLRTLTTGWILVIASYHSGNSTSAALLAIDLTSRVEASKSDPELKEVVRLASPLFRAYWDGKRAEELRLTRRLLEQFEKVFGRDHFLSSVIRRRLADILFTSGTPLPKANPNASVKTDIQKLMDELAAGQPLSPAGKGLHPLHEAARLYATNTTVGPKWDRTLNRRSLGRVLERCGLIPEAIDVLEQALAEYRKQPPELSRDDMPYTFALVARVRMRLEPDSAKVEEYFRAAVRIAKANPRHVSVDRHANSLVDLAYELSRRGNDDEAVRLYADAIALGDGPGKVTPMRMLLIKSFREFLLRKLGRIGEADELRAAIEKQSATYKDGTGRDAVRIRALLTGQTVPWP